MPVRVAAVNNIEEAFLRRVNEDHSVCPYCSKHEPTKKDRIIKKPMPMEIIEASSDTAVMTREVSPVKNGKVISRGPWFDSHFKRCKKYKESLKAEENILSGGDPEKRHRYGIHEQCGGCMILETRLGLCMIENDSRRYVVAARDMTIGSVASLLEIIDSRGLLVDQ